MEATFKFSRGDRVSHKVTKFTGIVEARMDSINGCNRYLVQPEQLSNGKMIEAYWIDEQALTLSQAGVFDMSDFTGVRPGGPMERGSL